METDVGRNRMLEKRIGCVTGFFQIFGRQHVLNGKRLHRPPVVDYSSELERSGHSSSVSVEFDDLNARSSCLSPLSKRHPRTPEATTPAVTTPPSASGYEYKEMARSIWKFRESPRLSLDSRATTVGATESIFTTQIREGVENQRKSTGVIARLMGLESLPDSDTSNKTVNPELRRSASESRVCKDLFSSRFIAGIDSCQKQSSSIAKTEAAKSSNQIRWFDNACTKKMTEPARKSEQRRISSYESRGDVYPEQKQIEKELKTRGGINLDEPLMDLATLKHVIEALQLKGLLRKTDEANDFKPSRGPQKESQPSSSPRPPRKAKVARESFPVAARNRNPRSPSTPGKAEEQRRAERSSSRSARKIKPPSMSKTGTASEAPSMSAETAFSDAESIKFEEVGRRRRRSVLERCDMLLRSMAEFNNTSKLHQQEGQPSPVSVLDSSFYNDDSPLSPSLVMKRSIVFSDVHHADPVVQDDPDFIYISEVYRLATSNLIHSDMFKYLEEEQGCTKNSNNIRSCQISTLQRKLIFDIAIELIRKHTQLPKWKTASLFNPLPLTLIWSEFKNIKDREAEGEDLIELIRNLLHNDLTNDLWSAHDVETTETVVDVERLMFKDLIEETIRDLTGKSASVSQPPLCRRLAF